MSSNRSSNVTNPVASPPTSGATPRNPKTKWLWIGGLSAAILLAVLLGVVLTGRGGQNNGVSDSGADPMATTAATPHTATATSGGQFEDAARIWGEIEMARASLDSAVQEKKLDQVHKVTFRIHDLVQTLPDKSSALPEDKRQTLESHVKNVGELAVMMDKSDNPNDMKSVQEHHVAMNDALDMMKGIYPAEAMRSAMHMPGMDSSGKGMPSMGDDKMGAMPADKMTGTDKPTDPGKGMPDDKMGGMGMMDKMPADKPMGGKPMSKPTDPGNMGGMDMMDKMTSGMSAMDKSEMKMMMDKMMAMPPAERKKAMKKMSGMGKPTDPADPNAKPMPGGAMGGDM